jgi:hypothetical protein
MVFSLKNTILVNYLVERFVHLVKKIPIFAKIFFSSRHRHLFVLHADLAEGALDFRHLVILTPDLGANLTKLQAVLKHCK